MGAAFEIIFDILYLTVVILLGVTMIRKGRHSKQTLIFGIMAVLLGVGDAFHLIPRIYDICVSGDHTFMLGIGKFVTSITMTVFYLLLYFVWRIRYQITKGKGITISMIALAVARCVFCLLPQNEWTMPSPSLLYAVLRNIPFVAMGLIVIVLFYSSAKKTADKEYKFMWQAITLSFVFYIPVVLFSQSHPPIGMLMMPKTLAYVWIVVIGYQSMRKEIKKQN